MDPAAMDVLHELQEMEAHSSCVKVEYGSNNCFSTVSI